MIARATSIGKSGNHTIRKVTPAGVVTLLVATGFSDPEGIAVDGASNVDVSAYKGDTISKLTPSGTNWDVTNLAGMAGLAGSTDRTGAAARFAGPEGVAVDKWATSMWRTSTTPRFEKSRQRE